MDLPALYGFIKRHRYAVLASTAADGAAQSALIGIAVTPELEIVFDTLSTSRKYANLRRDPRCSLVIGWSGEQTVQFEGRAEEPTGVDRARLLAAYFAVWPDGEARSKWPGLVYFAVRPLWLRYSDYDRNPALIEEFAPGRG